MSARGWQARTRAFSARQSFFEGWRSLRAGAPSVPLEALIISPCTGNTLAKIAHGITDGTVTMAAKAHLRRDTPLLIALASNDAMSQNLGSISSLLTRRSVYFVPMRQDDPVAKPYSLVAEIERVPEALAALREGRALRPLFI